ncbi:MAG: TIM barrel protein [Planctomycetes bacterium]|nr:TIM barrel protein [Planctomycetota bacterium]
MQIAISNRVCPDCPPANFVRLCADSKADGFVVYTTHGLQDVGPWGAWIRQPADARAALEQAGVRLLALHAGGIDATSGGAAALHTRTAAAIDAAKAVGCGLILLGQSEHHSNAPHARATAVVLEALTPLLERALDAGVRISLGLGGSIRNSGDLWNVHDALNSPAAGVWSDTLAGTIALDPPTIALKRLARNLDLVALSDATSIGQSGMRHTTLGAGEMNQSLTIELLRGLNYKGLLVVDYPTTASGDLPDLAQLFGQSVAWIRGELAKAVVPLTAYKGDKYAPKYPSRAAAPAKNPA